jgi:hypothetical protein
MCHSWVIDVVSPLVSCDTDNDAQDMIRPSRAYKSSGSSNVGVTSHNGNGNGNGDEREIMIGKTGES